MTKTRITFKSANSLYLRFLNYIELLSSGKLFHVVWIFLAGISLYELPRTGGL